MRVWHERAGLSANRNPEDAERRRANKDTIGVKRYFSRRFTQMDTEKLKYKEQIGFCFFMKKISGNLCRSVAK